MNTKKILIVDDELDLCEIIGFNLEQQGYSVDLVHSGEQALTKDMDDYHLILLDVMMEGMSGFEVLKYLREKKIMTPVIFITAMGQEDHLVNGFKLGADDYIKKPFSVTELVLRVKAVLSRYDRLDENMEMDGFKIDNKRKKVFIDKEPVNLTPTEFDILNFLVQKPGKVFSRAEIKNGIWTNQVEVSGRTVDVNITRMRRKLGTWGSCIITRSGFGYCFEEQEKS